MAVTHPRVSSEEFSWLLDPRDRTAIVIDVKGDARNLGPDQELVSAVLPGFAARVTTLFGDA